MISFWILKHVLILETFLDLKMFRHSRTLHNVWFFETSFLGGEVLLKITEVPFGVFTFESLKSLHFDTFLDFKTCSEIENIFLDLKMFLDIAGTLHHVWFFETSLNFVKGWGLKMYAVVCL